MSAELDDIASILTDVGIPTHHEALEGPRAFSLLERVRLLAMREARERRQFVEADAALTAAGCEAGRGITLAMRIDELRRRAV